jgi:pimeloyl-ACP methyl ester carboxylesterase
MNDRERTTGRTGGSVSRRALLGTTAVGLAGGAGVSGSASAITKGDGDDNGPPPETFPHVTTRGHFDIGWFGDVDLTDGNTDSNYGTKHGIPGLADGSPDEIAIHVHGWLSDVDGALISFERSKRALRANGYGPPVVGYSWDADTGLDAWWAATGIAERNGYNLAQFLVDYADATGGTSVRLVARSLGARVVLSAVKTLNATGYTDLVTSLSLLGGAADNDAVSVGGEYGDDLRAAVGSVDNLWKDEDSVLNYAYSTAEFDSAVGEEGCEGTRPSNYEDHNVNFVPDHYSYYEPSEGCMAEVVAAF